MRLISARTIVIGFTAAAAIYSYRTKRPVGRLLRIPYDFRRPTLERLRERYWNPNDPRLFTPTPLGVGWAMNMYHVYKHFQDEVIEDVLSSESEAVPILS